MTIGSFHAADHGLILLLDMEALPVTHRHLLLAGALAMLALAGCTTIGTGRGDMIVRGAPTEPVRLSWKSTDGGMSGTMTAAVPNATYTGPFFQITRQTQVETLAPLWNGWNPGWYDWPYWGTPWQGGYDATRFVTHYSGKVVANLRNQSGERMRCRFHLADPAGGMSGGGQGECQLTGGRVINAVISRS